MIDKQIRIRYNEAKGRGDSVNISIELSDTDFDLVKQFAAIHGISVSEYMRHCILEQIEDELDLKACNDALEEYKANPVSYPLEEVFKKLDLD